jgi:hypothetical protein
MEENELLLNDSVERQVIQPDPVLTPVNNPFANYNPGGSYVDKAFSAFDAQMSQPSMDKMLQPIAYDPVASSRDRYQNSDYFAELGFDPFRNNEELYGQRQTNMNKLSNAFSGMGSLAWEQVKEQAGSWGDTFEVMGDMAGGNFSLKAAFEQAEMEEINMKQQAMFNNNPIFETEADRNSVFNFNTIATTVQQSGYAIGAIAEIAAEEAALSALTALTFGGASEIQAVRTAKLAANIGKVARRTEDLVNATQKASTLRKIWSGVSRSAEFVGKNLMPLGNTIDFVDDFKKLSRVDDIAFGGSKALARTTARGFGSFYRDIRELNMAIAEAKAEAAGTFTELQEKRAAQFLTEKGREPDELEKQAMSDEALQAAQANGAINTYMILLSNKIAFGNILKGFGSLRYMLDDDVAKGLIMLGNKDAAKMGKRFIEAADNRWLAFKRTLLKNPVKYVQANLAEALQENAQDMSNAAVQNWYLTKEKSHEVDAAFDSMRMAAAEQFSVQGAKTFISGFLTGSILGAGSKLFENAGNIVEYVKDREGYDKRRADEVTRLGALKNNLNAIYENPLAYSFNPKEGVTMQANFASLMKDAAVDKDKKTFHDIQDDAMRHFIMTGITTGTLDVLTGRMQDYVKNLSPEEFTQAFGVEFSKENHESMVQQVTKFQTRAEQVAKIHNKLQTEFVNPFNPGQHKIGTPEFIDEAYRYMAFKEAVNQMTFMQDTYQATITRQQQVLDGIKTKQGFENLPFSTVFTLTSQLELEKEVNMLQQEIEVNTDPKLGAEKKAKLKKLERYQKALTKYLDKVDAIKGNKGLSADQSAEQTAAALEQFKKQGSQFFTEYVNAELEKNGQRPVQTAVANDAFGNLTDYFQLQEDQGSVLEHINLLADPDFFANYLDRNYKAFRAFAKKRAEQTATTAEDTSVEVTDDLPRPEDLDPTNKPDNTPVVDTDNDGIEEDEVDEEGQVRSSKPVFGSTFFFKTTGQHFNWDGTLNTENGSNRFFRFTERMMFEPDTYFLIPVTAANDTFGIRREDKYQDDIKLVVVKKVGDSFVYVDQEGNELQNPTKDTIVYTSMNGSEVLFGEDKAKAVELVKKNFATKDLTDDQILGAIENFKTERDAIKASNIAGEVVAFPVVGRSKGTVRLAPKDINTGMPQEIALQGSVIKSDSDDFLNLEHPNGEVIELAIGTVDKALNMGGVDKGRMVARGKKTGNVFRIKSRKFSEEELVNLKDALKALTKLMGKKNLTADQARQKKDILNYLSGTVFWSSPDKGKAAGPNQFYVNKGKLFRGTQSWAFTEVSIDGNFEAILENLYYSVNNSLLNKKGAFQAVKMNGGVAERETFPSYNAFLMDNTGGRRPILYTNSQPYNPNVNSADYQIEGRYLVFNTSDEPVSSKIPAPGEKDTLVSTPPAATGGLKWNKTMPTTAVQPAATTATPAPTTVAGTKSPTKKEDTPATGKSSLRMGGAKPAAVVVPADQVTTAGSSTAATPPAPAAGPATKGLDPTAMSVLLGNDIANLEDGEVPFQDEFYRLSLGNPDVKREDLAKVQAFLTRVLPGVPLHVVSTLIHNKAYGAFMRGAIFLYENAEEGTAFHEAFEAVWNAYLTAPEQAILAKEFSSRKGTFTNPFTGETKEYKDANMYDVREMLAEEFRTYILTGNFPVGAPKAKSFFTKVMDFIKKILGLSKEDRAEMDNVVNNLFVKINQGGFANAVPVRDLNNLQAVYRSIPGTTQEVTTYAVEGLTSYFFMNLYKEGKNMDALIKTDANNNKELVRLFNAALQDMDTAITAHFDAVFQNYVKQYEKQVSRKATEAEKRELKDNYFIPGNRLYTQMETIKQQPMELYELFKGSIGRFGVSFSDISEDLEAIPDELNSDGLGITDAVKIDPRRFGATNFKLLMGSLTDDVYNDKTKRYEFKKNALGLPKLSNYDRIYAILLNELNGSMSRIEGGEFVPGIDAMFDTLDKRFQKKNGVYKEGFEWIYRMKVRLKYLNPQTGAKIEVANLTPDDVRLRIAFEQSLTNMQNDPIKMVFGGDGLIYNDASLDTASQNNKRAEWSNAIKDTAVPYNQRNGETLLTINDNGSIILDRTSGEYAQAMGATDFASVLDALDIMGIKFTASNKALQSFEAEIMDAYSAIRSKITDESINTIDQLFGRSIVNGPIQTLLNIEVATTPEENVLVHKNAEGENQYTITQPSTISYLLNSFKVAKTLADFVTSNPQFGTVDSQGTVVLHPYQTNSMLLKKGGLFFDRNGKKRKGADLNYHLISGVTEATGTGKNTDVLTYPDRVMQEINHLLGNVHYTIINSDKSTEFGLGFNESLVSFDDANIFVSGGKVLTIYLDQLSDELDAAIAEHKNPSNIQYYGAEVKKLAHFRDILGPEFSARIKSVVEGKTTKSSLISSTEVSSRIMEYINNEIERTKAALEDMDMFFDVGDNEAGEVIYATNSINAELLAGYGIQDKNAITENELNNLIAFLVINKEVAVAEQHKLIYGHPALYKDLAKRSNGANSTKIAFIDNLEIRQWMDDNMSRHDGKRRSGEQLATFNNISFKDNTVVAAMMIEYVETMYKSMVELQKDKAAVEERIGAEFTADGKFVKLKVDSKGKNYGDAAKYLDINEADAQAWIMPDMFRDLLYLSSRMTHEQQAQWDYEIAYEMIARSSKPEDHVAYRSYSEAQLDAARATLAKGNPGTVLQVLKPQYFGYNPQSPLMHTVFLKNSTQPKFYRQVENTAFENLYLSALDRQIDIIGFESGQKVGNMLNQKGEFAAIYNSEGKVNIVEEEGAVNLPDIPVQNLLSRYLGIQQEMPNAFKSAVVRGTQPTKLIMSNFKFRGKYTSPEAEKLVTEYNNILAQMVMLGKEKLLKELGVTRNAAGKYSVKDVSKMVSLLRKEAKSRDLPDNIIDAIDTIENEYGKTDFRYPLDALPNRKKIDNILNSIVDSRVISEKMNGKPAVQVASTLFESKSRSFVYLKDGVWTSTKGMKLEDLSVEEQASVRMVSNDLKFYRMENGKIANMEVYLPNFLEGVNLPGAVNGVINVKDIDPRILKALGFRIPTQGMNSIESITIKGFLPREMGDMVVVPSEITGKAGSDFDIDKLQMYLANFYVAKNGKASYYEWKGTQEATREHYEKLYNKGEFITPEEQALLDTFLAEQLYYNATESISILEGKKIREVFSKFFDSESLTKDFLEEMKDVQSRKKAFLDAAVKKSIQNRYREIMQDLVTLPENMRQLITPNSTDTLKNMADEINRLKGVEDLTASSKYAIYRSLIDSADIRHRFLSGKKLVGIAALQITSQVMTQLGETKLTGKYDAGKLYYLVNNVVKNLGDNPRMRDVKINLSHNLDEENQLFLDSLTTQDGMMISDLINEALSGFVDAAKDPFVFSLNITIDTAGTWFYLQKLGVPITELAYMFNQPVLDRLFKERAKNKSLFKKLSGDKINDFLIALKMITPYYKALYPNEQTSLYKRYVQATEDGNFKELKLVKKMFKEVVDVNRKQVGTMTEAGLRDSIQRMNAKDYVMTAADAQMQIAVLADFLEYQEQSSNMTEFISGIGYDNVKTKSITENVMQIGRWRKVSSKGFIANPEGIMDNTFMGELKKQKEDIFELFTPFFVSLDQRTRKAFQPALDLLDSGAFLTRDMQEELIMKYNDFLINYIMQTTPFMDESGNQTNIAAHAERLLMGNNSMARRLKVIKESTDKNIQNNMFLKELMQVIASEEGKPDVIKMLRRVTDSYRTNLTLDSAKDLYQYAINSGNTELEGFLKDLAYLTMIQGGNQETAFNFVRVLPVEIFSNTSKLILDAFKNSPEMELNTASIWKQFHQNNVMDDSIVPNAKFYKNMGGFLSVSVDMDTAKRPYVKVVKLNKAYSKDQIEELRRNRQYDKMYVHTLYERYKEDGKGNMIFRPVNKKGSNKMYTEVNNVGFTSMLADNNTTREEMYPDNAALVAKPEVIMPESETNEVANEQPAAENTEAPNTLEIGAFTILKGSDGTYDIQGPDGVIADYVPTLQEAIDIANKADALVQQDEQAGNLFNEENLVPWDGDPFAESNSLSVVPTEASVEQPKGDKLDKKYELFEGVYANEGQRDAIDKIEGFLKGDAQQFLLKGRGGTGKTTIIQKAIATSGVSKNSIVGTTVSYEAKNVLQESMKGYKTATIASMLGLIPDYDKFGAMYFRERNADEEADFRAAGKADPIETARLIIVDEASMIGDFIYGRLLERKLPGAKIIFMGDNAQIPPIDVADNTDSPVWNLMQGTNYAELTERMRQASESPIIPVTDVFAVNIERIQKDQPGVVKNPLVERADKMENGEGVQFMNDVKAVVTEYVADYNNPAFTKGSVIVGARNEVVDNFNRQVRTALFEDAMEQPYLPGDFVRVNTPHYVGKELAFENGFKGKVSAVRETSNDVSAKYGFPIYEITVNTPVVDINGEANVRKSTMLTINPTEKAKWKTILAQEAAAAKKYTRGTSESKAAWRKFYDLKGSIVDIGYGYAITSHKVQGSTYDSTYVLENDIMSFPGGTEQQNRMMYTAVSRPRKKLVIFNAAVASTGATEVLRNAEGVRKFVRSAQIDQVKEDKDKGCN